MLILHESHDQLNWNENIRYYFYTAHLIVALAVTKIVKDGHNSTNNGMCMLGIKHGIYTHGLCETVKMRWERNDADEPQQLQYQDEENDVAPSKQAILLSLSFYFSRTLSLRLSHTRFGWSLSVRCLWECFFLFKFLHFNRKSVLFVSLNCIPYNVCICFEFYLFVWFATNSCTFMSQKKVYLLLLRLSSLLILV